MSDPATPSNDPEGQREVTRGAGGEHREGPSYDTSKQGYTGISAGALGSLSDLHAARDFAEMIVDTVREGLLVLDFDLRVQAANESFYRQFGVRPEETVGRRVYELGNGQWDFPELRELLEGILPENEAVDDYEVDHVFDGVGRRIVLLNARRLNHHQMILLAIEDITARRSGERELRQSEERFRLFVENAKEYAIFSTDEQNRITMWSPSAERILGWSQEEAVGMSGATIFVPEEREAGVPEQEIEKARAEGSALDERWHMRKDGSRFWATGTMVALQGESLRGFVKVLRDNTQRKEMEEALRENEERLRWAQEAAHVGTWDIDLATGEVMWSKGVFDLVGLPQEGGVPSPTAWSALLHPDDRERVGRQVEATIAAGDSYENEFRVVRPDGEVVWVAAKGRVLRDPAGRPSRLLGANYDVTQLKRTEEALRLMNETLEARVAERTGQLHKLSRALALAEQEERRRIAHILHDDLQQVLFGAKVASSFGDTARVESVLDEALTLTRTLSHSLSPPFLQGEDVEDLLRWVAEQHRLRYGLDVEVEVGSGVPVPDAALRVLLYQVVRELLFNVAKHAGTRRARIMAKRVDGHIHVAVEDEGTGFVADELSRSSGLGLPSMQERLELVGGTLDLKSAPGEGTRATIIMPVEGGGAG